MGSHGSRGRAMAYSITLWKNMEVFKESYKNIVSDSIHTRCAEYSRCMYVPQN